jgi:hypothetical protein
MAVLPQLKQDLLDAHPRVIPASLADSSHRRMRLPLGVIRRGLPLAMAVAVPFVVAAAVLLVVTRRGGESGPHPPVAAVHVAQSASRRGLIASLGVLREPQTAQDRTARFGIPVRRPVPVVISRPLGFPRADPSLSRVVSIPAWKGQFAFLPVTFRPAGSGRRVEGLTASLRLPDSASVTVIKPITVASFRTRGLLLPSVLQRTSIDALAVPDGVARVTFGPVSPDRPMPVHTGSVPAQTVTVHDNLALLTFSAPTAASPRFRTSTYFISAQTEAIWRTVEGHVIRRVRTSLQLPVQVQHTGRGTGCIAGPNLNYDGCDGPPSPVR